MVRTGASAVRASGGKSTKAVARSSTTKSFAAGAVTGDKGGGNSVCPRETPSWQKPINNFFRKTDTVEKIGVPKFTQEIKKGIDDVENLNNNNDVNSNDTGAGPSRSRDDLSQPGPSNFSAIPDAATDVATVEKSAQNASRNGNDKEQGLAEKTGGENKENDSRASQKRSNDSEVGEKVPTKKLKPEFYKHLEAFECT